MAECRSSLLEAVVAAARILAVAKAVMVGRSELTEGLVRSSSVTAMTSIGYIRNNERTQLPYDLAAYGCLRLLPQRDCLVRKKVATHVDRHRE